MKSTLRAHEDDVREGRAGVGRGRKACINLSPRQIIIPVCTCLNDGKVLQHGEVWLEVLIVVGWRCWGRQGGRTQLLLALVV